MKVSLNSAKSSIYSDVSSNRAKKNTTSMKKILSLFIFLSIFSFSKFNAQAPQFSINPLVQCYNGISVYNATAYVVVNVPAATSYSWAVTAFNPTTACPPTSVVLQSGINASVALTSTCCGVYQVFCNAYSSSGSFITQLTNTFQIVCPSGGSITVAGTNTNNAMCVGNSATLTGNGAVSYSWTSSTGGSTANLGAGTSIVVTPSANTTYTMVGQTALGCPITATTAIFVQSATFTVSPTSVSLCPGAPITFSSSSAVQTGTALYTPGTVTTAVQWYNPASVLIGTTAILSTTATNGVYNAVLVHTGAAGSCSVTKTATITALSTIPVTITTTPASGSVCPGSVLSLTATSQQTVASSYSWTAPSPTLTGRTYTRTINGPTNFTVNVNYFGCTGQATFAANIATITPSLTASSPSSCPGKSITLTASGGITYTFSQQTGGGGVFPLANATSSTAIHSPSAFQLNAPMHYIVSSTSVGCTGTATITVGLLALNVKVTPNPASYSVCPNRTVCFTPGNGAGTTYTMQSFNFANTFGIGTNYTTTNCHNPGTSFPHTYVMNADSAGCTGQISVVINSLVISPTITPSSFSICPGSTISLTSSGGAGTNYTFTAPYATSISNSIIPKATASVNTVQGFTTIPSPGAFPYTYVVNVDSLGCSGSGSVTIGLLTLTPSLTASSASVCPNAQFTLTGTGGANTSYTFIAPPTNSFASGTSTSGTTFSTTTSATMFPSTYSVVCDSLGCQGTNTVVINGLNISNNLTFSLTTSNNVGAPSNSVCPGNTFTLTANTGTSGSTYSFSLLPGTILPNPTATNNVITHSTTTFPAVYVVQAGNGGCIGTQSLVVNQMYLNNLTLTATPSLICAGMPATLSVSGVGNSTSNPTSFTYAVVNGTSVTSPTITPSGTVVVNPSTVTVYVFTADSAGCTSPNTLPINPFQTATVNIKPALTFTPSASSMSVCAGLPTTLSVAGPSNNISYTWTAQGGTAFLNPGPSPATMAIANPTTTTTYTIAGLDSFGCIGSTVITVGIDPTASLNVNISASSSTICAGLSSSLTATCNISPVSYSWNPSIGLTSGNTGSAVIASPSLTTIYNVVANNGYNCYGTASYTLNVGQYPTSLTAVANPSNVCPGYASTLTAFGANSYTWIGASAGFSGSISQQSISVGYVPATVIYTLIGSNGGGCTFQTISSIIGNPNGLTIGISRNTATTCIEDNAYKLSKPVVLTASGAQTYVWYPFDPSIMTGSLGIQVTVRPHATIIFTVQGSNTTCSGQKTIDVTVIPQFTMSVVPPLPAMCVGDSLKLSMTNISNAAVGPASAFTYSWTDPQAISMNPSAGLSPTVFVFPQSTTTYTAEVKDSRGCASTPGLITVTVLPTPLNSIAIPTINSVPTNTLCYVGNRPGPPDVNLNLTGVNKNTNLPFGVVPSYTWLAPNPKYPSILTSPYLQNVIINAPIKVPSVITYTLKSGYNGIPGCADFDTVSVRIIDCRSVGSFTFETAEKLDTICSRTCITFINHADTASGGPQTYTWTFPGGSPSISYDKNPTVCYNLPNKYNVFLKVKNPYPLTSSSGQVGSEGLKGVDGYIKVVDVPNVTIFSPGQLHSDSTIRFGQNITLNGTGAYRYNWTPNYNITSNTNPNVVVNPFRTTQYILTGYNSAGCFSSDTLNVIVVEDCGEMYVPNAFTPNDDKANDVLYVRGICLESISFMIFNRWGEKVFETTDQKNGWDGTYKGEPLNTGIYVYRLEGKTHEGKSFSAKGNITLIR